MLVPHLAPSGTRPGVISLPGCEVKDLVMVYVKTLNTKTPGGLLASNKSLATNKS